MTAREYGLAVMALAGAALLGTLVAPFDTAERAGRSRAVTTRAPADWRPPGALL
jgi:hypothetical protein